MPDKEMKLLNDDDRLQRIADFKVTIEQTVINNERRRYLSFSEPIVIDKGLAGEINQFAIQYLENYPAKEEFVEHMQELIEDSLLEGFCFFQDEYNQREDDVEGEYISFNETTDEIHKHKPQVQ